MNNACGMSLRVLWQRAARRSTVSRPAFSRSHLLAQCHTVDELHGMSAWRLLADFIDVRDVRMIEGSGGLRFLFEATNRSLFAARLIGRILAQLCDGALCPQPDILCPCLLAQQRNDRNDLQFDWLELRAVNQHFCCRLVGRHVNKVIRCFVWDLRSSTAHAGPHHLRKLVRR